MRAIIESYGRIVALVSGAAGEGLVLLLTRVALAGVFWRSGRTKVEDGSFLNISDTTYFLFENEYSGVPLLPHTLAAHLATYAETFLPMLLVVGLATRFSALALLGMTLVIQLFVFPDAWWTTHILWVGMAGILLSRGGGLFSLDALGSRMLGR